MEWIWRESGAFARFRGTDWMQEPSRTCPLGRESAQTDEFVHRTMKRPAHR